VQRDQNGRRFRSRQERGRGTVLLGPADENHGSVPTEVEENQRELRVGTIGAG